MQFFCLKCMDEKSIEPGLTYFIIKADPGLRYDVFRNECTGRVYKGLRVAGSGF